MDPYLEQLENHLLIRRLRQMGVEADDRTAYYTRMRLQHSPPFTQCPPGFIRDLHEYELDGPTVACPRVEPLLESLTEILIVYGTMFVETVGPQRKRRELDWATRKIRQTLERFFPEGRNKKLWRHYHALTDALQRIRTDEHRRLEKYQRELLKQWRHGLAHVMNQAFRTLGPSQGDYPYEAVYMAIASIYDDLSLERGPWRSLADRIRKRCEAHETLE